MGCRRAEGYAESCGVFISIDMAIILLLRYDYNEANKIINAVAYKK